MSKTPSPLDDAHPSGDEVRGIRFETGETGVTVVDQIERKREHFATTPVVEPTPASTDRLAAPVDRAVRLPVEEVATTTQRMTIVRNAEFDMIDHVTEGSEAEFPPGRYVLDISGPIKCYLQVDGRLSISISDRTTVSVGSQAEVVLGARSMHSRPTTEVTVPSTPNGLATAISTFGASLKTTSPDRSWPTLRGHPPAVSVGGDLDIPQGLEPPCPEIQVLVPPEERYLYAVAPLVYYLGAELIPHRGPPQIRTDAGFEHDLDGPDGFEPTVERTLKQAVFMECLVRSEGMIELPLHERSQVANEVSLDPVEVFHQPPEVRLPSYLSIEYDAIASQVPDWELAAHLAPRPEQAELLPYLVDDLAIVRTRPESAAGVDPADLSTPDADATGVDDPDPESMQKFFRSGSSSVGDGWTVENSVDLRDDGTSALETVWGGDGVPVGASKATQQAFENRLTRQPDPPPIDVCVVCNDDRMSDELDVTELYDDEGLSMEVTTYRNLSRAALQTLLEEKEADLLHYIGHADPDGLHCSDGKLSLTDIAGTDIEAFLLNACRSFDQGAAMIDAGAIGGVVTLQPVPIQSAVEVGKQTARLLNLGYPLRVAVSVVDEATSIGGQYQIVGDGGHVIAQRDTTVAFVSYLRPVDGSVPNATEYEMAIHAHPAEGGLGGTYHPHTDKLGHYLIGNTTDTVRLDRSDVLDYLYDVQGPVLVEGETNTTSTISWSADLIGKID